MSKHYQRVVPPRRGRGFTLIEAMVALVILLIAILGSLAGLLKARQSVADGQIQQFAAALVEAKAQRLLVANKAVGGPYDLATEWSSAGSLLSSAITQAPETVPIGFAGTPWKIDRWGAWPPSTAPSPLPLISPATLPTNADDLGTGAFFTLLPGGQVTYDLTAAPALAAAADCLDTHVPPGDFCREVIIAKGLPRQFGPGTDVNAPAIPPPAVNLYTVWIRVSKISTPGVAPPPSDSAVFREVFVL